MSKIIALIFAVIGLIFMVLVTLVGFGAADPQPMIDFAYAIAEVFRSFGTASANPTGAG